jgi:hypothetical protein
LEETQIFKTWLSVRWILERSIAMPSLVQSLLLFFAASCTLSEAFSLFKALKKDKATPQNPNYWLLSFPAHGDKAGAWQNVMKGIEKKADIAPLTIPALKVRFNQTAPLVHIFTNCNFSMAT